MCTHHIQSVAICFARSIEICSMGLQYLLGWSTSSNTKLQCKACLRQWMVLP